MRQSPPDFAKAGPSIARAALPMQRISYGPWHGSFRSGTAFECPRTHLAGTIDYRYIPRTGRWKRRKGSTQKFDTFGASVGLLPAKWSSKGRQFDELGGDKTSDGVPSLIALVTKETIASGLDDGRFSNLYYRDQANSVNYTLGDEFGSTTYTDPGTLQTYRYCAIGNLSGDGGLSRGVSEFQRRLLLGDPRGFLKVGRWFYLPGGPHGVPVRWDGERSDAGTQYATTGTEHDSSWGLVGADPAVATLTDDGDTTLVQGSPPGGGAVIGFRVTLTIPTTTNYTGWKFHVTARMAGSGTIPNDAWSLNTNAVYTAGNPPGSKYSADNGYINIGANWLRDQVQGNASYATYTYNISEANAAGLAAASKVHVLATSNGFTGSGSAVENVTQVRIEIPGSSGAGGTATAARLIPSGPLPPTHAGTIAKGNPVAGSSGITRVYPDADISTGAWVNSAGTATALYSYIDDLGTTADPLNDADFIAVLSNSTYICTLGDLGFVPDDDDTVQVVWRASRFIVGSTGIDLTVSLTLSDGTVIASAERTLVAGFIQCEFTLTEAQVAAVTAGVGGWAGLRVTAVTSGISGIEFVRLSSLYLEHRPAGEAQAGGWHGSDRFAYAMAYRFEDDSVWAFCVPRFPNTILPNGFNICTVDSANPTQGYDKITWQNLPVPLYGVKEKALLRTNKIDFTAEDNLAISLHDMRIVAWLDPSVTEYDDYFADDDAILDDPDKLWIHEDHIMPPRARHIFGGESRVGHSYGGTNPTAIELAPVGATVDYDRNVADDSATAYATPAMYFKTTSTALTLYKDSGTPVSLTLAYSDYPTLQDLVDRINATSCAADSMQWRAQICPAQNPEAPCATAIMPTYRSVASCVTATSTALTKAAGGLSDIPVGAYVTGTNVTAGTYVTRIVSDTELTLSAATTGSATNTMVFTANTGDNITGGTDYDGYVRARCNALPEFLYFTNTYLDQFPLEKASIWLTSANPESYNSAANCFRGDGAGKHKPLGDVGICMGGAAIGQGFVVPYSKARKSRISNTRDNDTGLDKDYHLSTEIDAGCIGPLALGNGCVFVPGPEGIFAMDMASDLLISGAIYQHPASDATAGVGDFTYEMPASVAATAADTDAGYLRLKVMGSALWVNYRTSGSHPNRQVVYDFSDSNAGTGLAAMIRDRPVFDDAGKIAVPVGVLWGWSLPLSRSVTQMTEGRRSDGSHLYGWNDANAGSAGDGRIDELEVTEQDNGTDIAASWRTPWESGGDSEDISAQEIYAEHVTATTATVTRTFTRSLTGDTYTGTPSKSDTLIVCADTWGLPITGARVASAACYCGGTQSAGPAQELRLVELRAKSVRDLTLGAAG